MNQIMAVCLEMKINYNIVGTLENRLDDEGKRIVTFNSRKFSCYYFGYSKNWSTNFVLCRLWILCDIYDQTKVILQRTLINDELIEATSAASQGWCIYAYQVNADHCFHRWTRRRLKEPSLHNQTLCHRHSARLL